MKYLYTSICVYFETLLKTYKLNVSQQRGFDKAVTIVKECELEKFS